MKEIFSLCILTGFFLFFWSCENNLIEENKTPTCHISSPRNAQEFTGNENMIVKVFSRNENKQNPVIHLFIDNILYGAAKSSLCGFSIRTGELTPGSHLLKAVVVDNEGKKATDSIFIFIQQPIIESPDFVNFSAGKIPASYNASLWYVDTTSGYDDDYSLKAIYTGTAVSIFKTCDQTSSFVEFYLKGNGTIDFFIDDNKKKVCVLTDKWIKHGFHIEPEEHSFRWEFSGIEVNLDAIRFKQENRMEIGQFIQGGIVAWLDKSGLHGLIAAPEDGQNEIQWYNGSYIATGASAMLIGSGLSNTSMILNVQDNGCYAAKYCDELVLNGYSDWFMPSKDELNILYENRLAIGDFDLSSTYWSSSEYNSNYAWYQDFSTGSQYYFPNKYSSRKVRAIRNF